jgi:hypothetical protein
MDFAAIVLFLVIYYIRPQEWIPIFAKLSPVKITMLFALFSTYTRNKGLSPKDFLQTPHDWLMAAYFAWAIWSGDSLQGSILIFTKYIIFYYVTVQVLSDMDRIKAFLNWWTVMILVLAALAVSSLYFWDPMGSKELTEGIYKGRLVLSTSIFNNPNALGHAVVPVLPMIYYLFLWKRPVFIKELALLMMIFPIWCMYETLSKGAYLSGGVTMLAAMMFSRPKTVQIGLVVFALTFGGSIISALPRMNELNRSEGGIQGRIAAWTWGLQKIEEEPDGIGWKNFVGAFRADNGYGKAAHSSYIQTATELGKNGLFCFVGILYCCMRTLVTVKTINNDEERMRRLLFCLVSSFALSSWVIDFGARSALFIIPAAVAAFHRQIMKRWERESKAALGELATLNAGAPEFNEQQLQRQPFDRRKEALKRKVITDELDAAAHALPPISWNKLGVIDIVLMWVCYKATIKVWIYVVEDASF